MQNEIIRVMDPASVMPNEQLAGEEGQIFVWCFPSSQQEAEYLADSIHVWINREQLPPSEIAVLIARQPDIYGDHLMAALERRRIPFRNEQQIQDISVEPAARLVIDYLSCLYGQREPKGLDSIDGATRSFCRRRRAVQRPAGLPALHCRAAEKCGISRIAGRTTHGLVGFRLRISWQGGNRDLGLRFLPITS